VNGGRIDAPTRHVERGAAPGLQRRRYPCQPRGTPVALVCFVSGTLLLLQSCPNRDSTLEPPGWSDVAATDRKHNAEGRDRILLPKPMGFL